MYYTIYKITNTINKKVYVGKHQTLNINDNYLGSGRNITAAIKKYGKENFVKEILFVYNNEDEMNSKEKELITEEFVGRTDTYNIGIGGQGGPHFKGQSHSTDTKKKISAKNTGRKHSPDAIKKMSDTKTALALTYTEEYKSKVYASRKGKPQSDEHRKKISNALTGTKKSPMTEEHKKKIGDSRRGKTGKPMTEEHKKKMIESRRRNKLKC